MDGLHGKILLKLMINGGTPISGNLHFRLTRWNLLWHNQTDQRADIVGISRGQTVGYDLLHGVLTGSITP